MKQFRYKGKKYIVSELNINVPTFTGCCRNLHDTIACFINSNLSNLDKQLTLHRLISGKKLRCKG